MDIFEAIFWSPKMVLFYHPKFDVGETVYDAYFCPHDKKWKYVAWEIGGLIIKNDGQQITYTYCPKDYGFNSGSSDEYLFRTEKDVQLFVEEKNISTEKQADQQE